MKSAPTVSAYVEGDATFTSIERFKRVVRRPWPRLAFRDDGPGIPAGDRDRIVEPFFTRRRTSGGTGLGLPIVRPLLQAHHGTILLDPTTAQAQLLVTLSAYAAMPTRRA